MLSRCTMRALKPTPPRPSTITRSDLSGFAIFSMAPAPVWIPQPRGAKSWRSSFERMRSRAGNMHASLTMLRLAKLDCPKCFPATPFPSFDLKTSFEPMMFSVEKVAQYAGWPVLQLSQLLQWSKDNNTGSPSATSFVTFGPSALT